MAYEVDRNKIIAALSLNKTQNPKVAITHKFLKSFLGTPGVSKDGPLSTKLGFGSLVL